MKRSSFSFSVLSVLLVGCLGSSCSGGAKDPAEAISQFYIGTLALQTGEDNHPLPTLTKAYELAPDEPAIAANLALTYTRKNQLDKAAEFLAKAKQNAPNDPDIAAIEGLILGRQGKYAEALAAYQRAVARDPKNLKALYQIAELGKQLSGADGEAQRKKALEGILAVSPDNLAAQLLLAQTLARSNEAAALAPLLVSLEARKSRWSAAAQAKLAVAKSKSGLEQVRELAQLENIVKPSLDYQAGLSELVNNSKAPGDPLQYLLKLPAPPATPAKPDSGLSYAAPTSAPGTLALALGAESKPVVVLPEGAVSVAPFDVDDIKGTWADENKVGAKHPDDQNKDYKLELAAAGPGGLKLYENGKLLATKLPAGPCTGVWAADIETDGDLDLIVSPPSGKPYVLQNNGDRTFTVTPPKFNDVACPIRAFAWADFDEDGDTDPAFIDANGKLIRYTNERSGAFKRDTSSGGENAVALTVAEASGDAKLDLIILEKSGQVVALAGNNQAVPLVSAKLTDPQRIFAADLDNNGAVDLLIAGKKESEVWLSDGPGKFAKEPIATPLAVTSIADLDGDGLLDVVGTANSKPVQSLASGKEKYKSLTVTLKADSPDNPADKINTFCLGGSFEVRAGLLYQKLAVTGPQMHLGLGTYEIPDAVRMAWPNGRSQSTFRGDKELKAGEPLVADQALGGSCPFLYTWNGKEFVFVTDCIWRSPLGLKINAQDTAGATQTEDWVKVRGDQLAAKNGFYELSITAELNETHYFDQLSLMTVDHPENTEIFVDERFNPTQGPLLKVIPTGPTQAFGEVRGWKGQDVRDTVAQRDTRYLDDFGRGKYQGIAGDHWVELALPESAPRNTPLYLIAHGWLHPTNTSLNVAMSQDKSQGPPQGLSLWTPDGKSKDGWSKKRDALGFPAGKLKTIVLRLDDIFPAGSPRRVRLRTNLEVFWDQLQWAEARPDSVLKIQRLPLASAQLRYRGFSVVKAVDASSPELPVSYAELGGETPRWRDLTGFVTRFGDVKALLTGVDDRYAILNAGDEILFKFPASSAPEAGKKRDFVVISDGWEKDGNINTTFGKTVGPYPLHALKDYPVSYSNLTDDPAYQKHPEDFANYHTRWVTPEAFVNAFLPPQHRK